MRGRYSPSAGGYIKVALNIGIRAELSIWAGWMLDPERPVLLVLSKDSDLEEVQQLLLRVGYTKFGGYLRNAIEGWVNAGLPLGRTLLKWGDRGGLTLPRVFGVPRAPFAVGLGVVLVGVLVVLERIGVR